MGGAVYSSLEVSMDMAVDDPSIINNSTVTDAMIDGFADVMAVDADDVTLDFIVNRRLSSTRKLSSTLTAIFTVVMESVEAAIEKQVAIETVSLQKTTEAISTAVASTGFTGTLVVTGKSTARVAAPTREDEVSKGTGLSLSLGFWIDLWQLVRFHFWFNHFATLSAF